MKSIFLLLSLFLVSTLGAQQGAMTVTERETDDSYAFTIVYPRGDKSSLIAAFAEATGQQILGSFSGDWRETDPVGVVSAVDTRRRRLTVRYEGNDDRGLTAAKQQVSVIRRMLGIPEAPVPPALKQ